MKNYSETQNIKSGVILAYLGMIVSTVFSLIITKVILRYIGDYNYGLYSFVRSITEWLTIITAALNASYVRFATLESTGNTDKPGTVNTIYLKLLACWGAAVLVIGITVASVLYCSHHEFLDYNWEDSRYIYMLFALSVINVALTMPSILFSLHISYRKQFIFARLLTIGTTILNFIGHFLIACYTHSILLLAGYDIFIVFVTTIVNFLYCKRRLKMPFTPVRLRTKASLIQSIYIFSGIIVFNTIVDQINNNVDKTLLGIFSTPGQVTVYQIGQQFYAILVTMSLAISSVYVPSIHEFVISKNQEGINRLYLKISGMQSIILCCVTFGFIACGREFISWWLGDSMLNVYYIGAGLMLLGLCPLSINSSIDIQRAHNKHLFRAITYFALALANVCLSIVFIKIFDEKYAIFACLLGTIITTISSHWIAINIYNYCAIHLPVGKSLRSLFTYIAAGCLGVLVTYFVCKSCNASTHFGKLCMQGTVYVITYGIICALINIRTIAAYIRTKKNGCQD